jgi:hypothetical protein
MWLSRFGLIVSGTKTNQRVVPLWISPCRSADSLRGADYCMATNARLLYADLAAPTHSGSRYRPPTLHGQRRSRSNISHINRGTSAWRQAYFHRHGERACKSSLPFTRCAPTHTSHSQNSPASTRIKIRPPTSLTEHFRILLLSVSPFTRCSHAILIVILALIMALIVALLFVLVFASAASQDFALHDEIGSRAWWLLLVGLLARCCCCCWSGRCCRCRCGRRGAASRCWLVQLGAMGAWVAVGSAARPRSAMRAATARPPAYTTKRVTGASGRARGRTAV